MRQTPDNPPVPVLGFAAYSGTGKTTLLKSLIQGLAQHGVRTALIKHTHHNFDIDHPGKDSYELRQAGAQQTLVASQKRWALMHETPENTQDPDLTYLLQQLDTSSLDLILVEGFKHAPIEKIELHRKELAHPCLYTHDKHVIALATNDKMTKPPRGVRILDINAPGMILEFILEKLKS